LERGRGDTLGRSNYHRRRGGRFGKRFYADQVDGLIEPGAVDEDVGLVAVAKLADRAAGQGLGV
jgi:hypothetical protein